MKTRKMWRCFHCDELFRGRVRAGLHFGTCQNATPLCQINPTQFREMEAELAKYRSEDSELHRQIRSMECTHAAALRTAEESGYGKGLEDGRRLAAPQCEWNDDDGRCQAPATYRTHWFFNVCRGHGSILLVNHGQNYLVDL